MKSFEGENEKLTKLNQLKNEKKIEEGKLKKLNEKYQNIEKEFKKKIKSQQEKINEKSEKKNQIIKEYNETTNKQKEEIQELQNTFKQQYRDVEPKIIEFPSMQDILNDIHSYDTFKILLIGDKNVGKFTILKTFLNEMNTKKPKSIQYFSTMYKVTKEKEEFEIELKIGCLTSINDEIDYKEISKADVVILVFDFTKLSSFKNIKVDNKSSWKNVIQRYSKESALKFLVGNKFDSEKKVIEIENVKELSKEIDFFFETNSQDSKCILKIFHVIIEKLIKNRK
eukprot:gene1125-10639_t